MALGQRLDDVRVGPIISCGRLEGGMFRSAKPLAELYVPRRDE
jgi:hypothetical protein